MRMYISSSIFFLLIARGGTLIWKPRWGARSLPTPLAPSAMWEEGGHSPLLRPVGKVVSSGYSLVSMEAGKL